jgi:hypothetical protein
LDTKDRPDVAEFVRVFVDRVLALAALQAAVVGCTGKDPYNPGSPLGTFHVSAKLDRASCGPAPDPWQFDVRLSHDASTLYWIQGAAPIAGRVDSANRVVLTTRDQHLVRPADTRTKTAECVLVREDVLDVVLRGATPPASDLAATAAFSGALTYRFAPQTASDCSDQVTPAGGDFAALPCEVVYSVEGARTEPTTPTEEVDR